MIYSAADCKFRASWAGPCGMFAARIASLAIKFCFCCCSYHLSPFQGIIGKYRKIHCARDKCSKPATSTLDLDKFVNVFFVTVTPSVHSKTIVFLLFKDTSTLDLDKFVSVFLLRLRRLSTLKPFFRCLFFLV